MRNYVNAAIVVGNVYKTDFGNVKVVKQIDSNCFEVAYVTPKTRYVPALDTWVPYTDLGTNYIVNSKGHFGICWNNPKTLCHID